MWRSIFRSNDLLLASNQKQSIKILFLVYSRTICTITTCYYIWDEFFKHREWTIWRLMLDVSTFVVSTFVVSTFIISTSNYFSSLYFRLSCFDPFKSLSSSFQLLLTREKRRKRNYFISDFSHKVIFLTFILENEKKLA